MWECIIPSNIGNGTDGCLGDSSDWGIPNRFSSGIVSSITAIWQAEKLRIPPRGQLYGGECQEGNLG